ncbi:MAG: GTP-binding protein, partial [Flavobacteriaceae bacterium]|nr:GTP-binding protein [Flavobacteriaceae bacterium]
MSLGNEIVLRPRFQMELQQDHASALNLFEAAKYSQKRFVISRVDNHVFIRLPKQDQHFWSPQLHLEILDNQGNGSILKGLFGPNPTVWTMFM